MSDQEVFWPNEEKLSSEKMSLDESLGLVRYLAAKGGPDVGEYQSFWSACREIGMASCLGQLTEDSHEELIRSLGIAGTEEGLIGHIFHKPYGYDGDFDLIDKIHRRWVSPNPMVERWDRFVQSVPLCESVRNRGAFLSKSIRNMRPAHSGKDPLRVLSLGSGPGTDILSAINDLEDSDNLQGVAFTCVDMDQRAIVRSMENLEKHEALVDHVHRNVLRLKMKQKFDLIWASGLFDYFNDNLFRTMLSKMKKIINPNGIIIVGNFSDRFAGPGPMSFVRWKLTYRSALCLKTTAESAGFVPDQIQVASEPLGLNLFLVCRTGS